MTRKELKEIGFKEEFVPIKESGAPKDFYYYVFEKFGVCLISESFDKGDDEKKDIKIEFFDTDENHNLSDNFVREFIKLIKNE